MHILHNLVDTAKNVEEKHIFPKVLKEFLREGSRHDAYILTPLYGTVRLYCKYVKLSHVKMELCLDCIENRHVFLF
jgi:hypothetical protein